MAQAVQNGQKVVCVTMTKGEAGQTADPKRWPQERLAEIRTEELETALKLYGITEHHWFDYHDGSLDQVHETEVTMHLRQIIEQVQPDTILTFAPDGITGHEDHKAVSWWALGASRASETKTVVYGACESSERYEKLGQKFDALFDVYWNVDMPEVTPEAEIDICFQLPKDVLAVKLRAMESQASQYHTFFNGAAKTRLTKAFVAKEYFLKLS